MSMRLFNTYLKRLMRSATSLAEV